MMKVLAWSSIIVASLTACSSAVRTMPADVPVASDLAAARAALAPKLQEMLAAANAHDTDRHLAAYLHSPDLVFVVNDQMIHGWDALRVQQLKWWQNGKSDAVYTVLGEPEYTMLAPGLVAQTYFLDSHRAGDDAHGAHLGVTDVWQQRAEGWRIVYAHESVTPR